MADVRDFVGANFREGPLCGNIDIED